ncbi:hypothetical protein ACOMHN_060273 [Nucella lapillus]
MFQTAYRGRVQQLSLDILRPLVTFVLLDPSPSHPQAPLLRLQLQHLLLRVCCQSAACDRWLTYLTELLPCYQANTAEAVSHLSDHVRMLLHTLTQRHTVDTAARADDASSQGDSAEGKGPLKIGTCAEMVSRVTQAALSLLLPAVRHQLDVQGLLHSILAAAQHFPQCVSGEARLVQLCQVLMELGPFSPTSVLRLVELSASSSSSSQPAPGTTLAAGMLVLPVLQFLAGPPPAGGRQGGGPVVSRQVAQQRQTIKWASAALTSLQTVLARGLEGGLLSSASGMKAKTGDRAPLTPQQLFGSEVESEALTDLMTEVATDVHAARRWLTSLRQHLSGLEPSEAMSGQTTCVACSVLLIHRQPRITSLTLDVLVHIARLDNTKAPLFLPLLLYRVQSETLPEVRLLLLQHLPLMAQHKLCVPPILKTLQALLTSPKLRALAIRLMTSLWQLQDRCFPQLLKAIGEEEASSSKSSSKSSSSLSSALLSPDVLLAKAAAVKEICRLRPEQHGADLLAPLHRILQTATGPQGAAPSALALEGLYYLCQAEVIDIQSAWTVLAKQLTSEKRGVVLVKVCHLLSLVPSLAVNTPDYEEFQKDTVSRLWTYTQSTQTAVQGAAFRALSLFSVDNFRVSHLPRQLCEELHIQVEMMQQQQLQQEGEEKTNISVDTLFTFIPGVCYTRLLKSLPVEVLPDYEEFLSKMVGREVELLPRGIYHAATRRHGTSTNQDKAIASIPQFIGRQYGNTKQPGLRPSLAAALLFCFDPPVEVGRDGRPRKHYIVRHGKTYTETFTTLLNEVPVQPSEWHRSLLMPQAWVSFMERLCLALIESRGAELDIQVKHGHITEDQREEKTQTAWLFVRDNIVDTLKATSNQQANSVLALAALTVFVTRHANGLDPEVMQECDRATEHLSHAHWLTVAVDTVLSLRDVSYRARGQLLGFAQQRSADDRAAATNLAQASACVSLGTLVPCLTSSTVHAQVVRYMLRELSWGLPGGRKASDFPVLMLHNGLGLGMVLGKLFQEGFCDLGGGQDRKAVWESLKALEDVCLKPSLEHRSGSVLGLGLALTGLCQDGKPESRDHVTETWNKLSSLLDNTPPQDHAYQALCFSLACVSGSAFTSNVLRIEDINASLHQLEMAHASNPQVTGCSLGLGMLCFTLSKMGHPGVVTLRQNLTSQWLAALTSSDAAPTAKVAALNGLMALIGSEQTLILVQAGVSLTSSDIKASEVVELVTRMVQGDPDLGIQSNAAWMLGHLHLSACSVAENRAAGPDTVSSDHTKVALAAIQDDVTRVLPPLNWAGVLSPVMRMSYGSECQRLCLTLALSQGASAPTAAMFLNSWLTPPLSSSLSEDSSCSLFTSLPTIIKSVSPSILTTFLHRCCLLTLAASPSGSDPLAAAVLQGLAGALRVPDPPEAVTAVLYDMVRQTYAALPAEFCPVLYRGMAECLAAVPDEIFDSITAEDYASGTCSVRALFIGCCLVARGNQPITLLNGLIDSAMNSPQCGGEAAAYSLAHCLWSVVAQRKESCGPMERLNWLVELLGHSRNIATRAVPLPCPTQTLDKAVEFSVLVISMAFTLLTAARPSPDLGLDPALLKVKDEESEAQNRDAGKEEEGRKKEAQGLPKWSGELMRTFLAQLPVAVLAFESTPWDQLLPKVFDWLLTMSRLSDDILSADVKSCLAASTLMLRHSSEFRKTNNWTRVLATV